MTPKKRQRRLKKLKRVGAGRFTYAEERDPSGRDLYVVERDHVPFKRYYTPEHAMEFLDMRRDEMYGRDYRHRNPAIARYDPDATYEEVWGEVMDIAESMRGSRRRNPLPTQLEARKLGAAMVDVVVEKIPKESISADFRAWVQTEREISAVKGKQQPPGVPRLAQRWFKYNFERLLKASPSDQENVLVILALLDLGRDVKSYRGRSAAKTRQMASPAMESLLFDEKGKRYALEDRPGERGTTTRAPYRGALSDLNRGIRDQAVLTLQTWYDASNGSLGVDVKAAPAGTPAPAAAPRRRRHRPMELRAAQRPVREETVQETVEELDIIQPGPEPEPERRAPARPSATATQAQEVIDFLMANPEIGLDVCEHLDGMRRVLESRAALHQKYRK